jgi:hypothetical protein
MQVRLEGRGRAVTDVIPGHEGRFERVFAVEDLNHTPSLVASNDLEQGWSLLSWTGPFVYVGQDTVIDPDGRWLPGAMSVVDTWIEEVLGA